MKLLPGRYAAPLAPLLVICLLALSPRILADNISLATIEDTRARVNTDAALAQADRDVLLGKLDAAKDQLELAATFRARSARLRAEQEQAPQHSAEFDQQLRDAQASPPDPTMGVSPDDPVSTLESELTLATTQRDSMIERRNQLFEEVETLSTRRAEIRERLLKLQSIVSEAPPQGTVAADDTSEEVTRILGLARKQSAEAEQEALEVEIATEPARSTVNTAERAWLGYAITREEDRVDAIQLALDKARDSATRKQLETASQLQQKLQMDNPRISTFAEENRQLATDLQEVTSQIDHTRREGQSIQALLNGIRQDAQLMERRLQAAGRKESLGRVMISRLDSLPDTPALQRSISRRNELIAETSLAQIDIEEAFRDLNENRTRQLTLHRELAKLEPEAQDWVRGLVDQRIQLLESNLTSLGNLLRLLLDNNDMSVELITQTEAFHKFLLGNLLWVRNFSFLEAKLLYTQLATLTHPQSWLHLPAQVMAGYTQLNWSPIMLAIVVLAFLMRRRLRPFYESLLTQPVRLSAVTLWNILAALLLTAVLVAPWPISIYVLGYFLDATPNDSPFSSALAPALMYTSRVLYALLFIRLIANRVSVGRRFLKWDARMLDLVRAELNWAGPLICLSFLVNRFTFHLDVASSGGPLGALATATSAIVFIVFCLRLLRSDVFSAATTVRVGLRITIIVSVAVLLMLSVGLLFAAEMYMVALARSIAVLLAIKTVSDALERWLLILRARMQRDARLQRSQEEAESADEQERQVDMLSLSEAHAKLLGMVRVVATIAALWMIWSPSLPALNLLESITLWTVADSANPGILRDVTLFDLLYSAFILAVTVLVTRNLPSLSEVFMREWFNMSAGARYASGMLLQYLVIAIGVSMFLATIGWEWGKVQWLVAALGVGIGFGLQEIVANFISGIIILFERPVRVGDIISAGGAEGVVKQINPRATIIETFDRKEHLIPNKELITGQVINWTLSDGAVRVIIPVGIAYGSDVRRAMALLLEAAGEVDNVLPDPAPRASFEDFGDNALVLWLRCFVAEDRMGTWTALRTVINDKFVEAGITISFPQRDVHLDTLEPLQVEVRHLPAT